MSSMKDAMEGVWDAFDGDVNSYLDQHYNSVDEVFRNALRVTRVSGRSTTSFSSSSIAWY